jgi:protein subunit release factor B
MVFVMAKKFELEAKDLRYDWFSGTGAGGQHRNKHQNCLRLKHIPTGIQVMGQNHRDRPSNERDALEKLTLRVKSFLHPEVQKERFKAKTEIRVYKEHLDLVKGVAGETASYKEVVIDADAKTIDRMIEARKTAMTAA